MKHFSMKEVILEIYSRKELFNSFYLEIQYDPERFIDFLNKNRAWNKYTLPRAKIQRY